MSTNRKIEDEIREYGKPYDFNDFIDICPKKEKLRMEVFQSKIGADTSNMMKYDSGLIHFITDFKNKAI